MNLIEKTKIIKDASYRLAAVGEDLRNEVLLKLLHHHCVKTPA